MFLWATLKKIKSTSCIIFGEEKGRNIKQKERIANTPPDGGKDKLGGRVEAEEEGG